MQLHYGVVTRLRVLTLYYDPVIDTVAYEDMWGPLPTVSYSNRRLHSILRWSDPGQSVARSVAALQRAAGGVVDIQVDENYLDLWPMHIQGELVWAPRQSDETVTPGPSPTPYPTVLYDPEFRQWTDDTFPAYPHIPSPRRAWWPDVPEFDYDYLLTELQIPGVEESVAELLNQGRYDEVWIVADPTSNLGENNQVVPAGWPNPLDLNGDSPTASAVSQVSPVEGYNLERTSNEILHVLGHRAERVFASIADGNRMATCLVNRTENNHYNHFTRIYGLLR